MKNEPEYRWNSKSILVVEDDEASAYLLGEILKGTGAHIDFSRDGEDAIAYIREHPDTDLVLMDVQLPQIDGFTATRKIKSFARDVIVIAQTAYVLEGDREMALEAGCNDYISKPIDKNILLQMINVLSSELKNK